MKNCTNCNHAKWRRTDAGLLHPSGDGACEKTVSLPKLPASKYWMSQPIIVGGAINRREPLKDHCPHYAWRTSAPSL